MFSPSSAWFSLRLTFCSTYLSHFNNFSHTYLGTLIPPVAKLGSHILHHPSFPSVLGHTIVSSTPKTPLFVPPNWPHYTYGFLSTSRNLSFFVPCCAHGPVNLCCPIFCGPVPGWSLCWSSVLTRFKFVSPLLNPGGPRV